MLPQRYLPHVSGSGTAVAAFSAYLSLCPVAMIVVRGRFQQHIVARIKVWQGMTCDGIGYDFEYNMRVAPLHLASSRLTQTTGILGGRTSSTVSGYIILYYRHWRRPDVSIIIPFLALIPLD